MSQHAQSQGEVSEEVHLAEFQRFVEGMDLDLDPTGLDDEDKKSLEDAKRRVLRAMRAGQLTINEKCEPVFKPSGGGGLITFYEPTGSTLMASDQKKKGHDVAKTFAALGDMTRENPSRFAAMSNRDIKVCSALFGLFMGG